MARARTYACPGNGDIGPHQFTYLHHPSVEADPLPRFCAHCGFDSEGEEMEPALTTPHIGKPIRQVVDNMHREMEAGAEHRANLAMEHHGMDSADAAVMKMTDMKDHLHEGDISAVEVKNDITKVMEAAPPGMFGFQGAQGLGYSGPVAEGPFPNAGARTQAALRKQHANYTSASGMAGAATSSLPALETVAPGYRRRV